LITAKGAFVKIVINRIALIFLVICSSCIDEKKIENNIIVNEVKTVLQSQERAWNEGNIEKYMEGYWKSDSLRFASGGNVSYGWQATLENYKRGYPDKTAMGNLTFSDIEVTLISDNAAIVFGKWALERDDDNPWGLFTLLFRKKLEGWKVVADHTSSSE